MSAWFSAFDHQSPSPIALRYFFACNVPVYTGALVFISGEYISIICLLALIIFCLSFVRSVSMDTWQDEQIKRMQVKLSYWVNDLLSD